MVTTIIIAGLLIGVFFIAARKTFKDLKNSQCSGCSGCSVNKKASCNKKS